MEHGVLLYFLRVTAAAAGGAARVDIRACLAGKGTGRGVPNGRVVAAQARKGATQSQTREVLCSWRRSVHARYREGIRPRKLQQWAPQRARSQRVGKEYLGGRQQPTPLLSYSHGGCHGFVDFRKSSVNRRAGWTWATARAYHRGSRLVDP
jgi:hypothetical protein